MGKARAIARNPPRVKYELTGSIVLAARLSHSFGIGRDEDKNPGDELLLDFFHAGVGLRCEF
jgi:hypothetical protein